MNKLFPILAVETSGELCSTALLLDEKNFVELNYFQKQIHSEKLIDMVDTVLKNGKVEISQVNSIAVSMGPGSFTGLRIGLSAAKGLGFGAKLPLIPVPTFNAFAYQVSQYLNNGTKFSIAVNANIDELYFAKYIKKENKVEVTDELKLVEKKNFESEIDQKRLCYGNFSAKECLNNVVGPSAYEIGKWAYLFGKDLLTFDYDYLEPNYFKNFIPRVKA